MQAPEISTPNSAALQGQTCVVFGGSSGVGLATAQRLAAQQATVVIVGRDEAKLREAVTAIGSGAQAAAVSAHDRPAVEQFFAGLGSVHHLVLTLSGGKGIGLFRELDLDDLRTGFDGKFWAQLSVLKAALPYLASHASVTFVTAISARAKNPGTSGLAAINGALETMVPILAKELQPLRVNAVSPGVIDTPWWDFLPAEAKAQTFQQYAAGTPVGRVGQPDDVAHAIEYLVENSFVTGTVLEVDGGLRLI
jgi:NAD(P)-dependent dehydrogenase (short-subunit alcohol dehydrogenase family)